MKLIYRYSLTSSFKSRSKLTEFYKAIHPDKLNNASDKVKEENARSLQILNSYFDALVQNQRATQEKLIFYIPEKSNVKSKNFHPIEVTLDAFRGESEENIKLMVDKTIKNLISILNEKQEEIGSQHITKKKSKQKYLSNEDKEQIEAETLRTMTLEKRKLKFEQRTEYKALAMQLYNTANQEEYKRLNDQVMKEMYQANTPLNKPKLWQKILLEESEDFSDLNDIFNQLIDPRMIFLDESLNNDEIQIFKSKITPKYENQETIKKLKSVFNQMEYSNPQISLHVSRIYSGNKIPGCFTIPFDFNPVDLVEKFIIMEPEIKQDRKIFEKELQNYEKVLQRSLSQWGLNNLKIEIPIKDTQTVKMMKIALLKLENVLMELQENKQIRKLNELKEKKLIITNKDSKESGILVHPEFQKDQLIRIIDSL